MGPDQTFYGIFHALLGLWVLFQMYWWMQSQVGPKPETSEFDDMRAIIRYANKKFGIEPFNYTGMQPLSCSLSEL